MAGVDIVSDSSCDLEQHEADQLNITVVPLSIRFGNEEFSDRDDLSVEDFYKRMANSDVLPQTACPSPGAFEHAFRVLRRGWCGRRDLHQLVELIVDDAAIGADRGPDVSGSHAYPHRR